jgi:small-conductance mechanosensitive channel
MTLNELFGWIARNGIVLVVGGLILFAIYRFALRMIHRVVLGLLRVQQATLEVGSYPAELQQKRAVTLEVVLGKLIHAGFLVALLILVLGVFDLWPLLAGLGLVAAALTLAGQAIVLDYLLGILISSKARTTRATGSPLRPPRDRRSKARSMRSASAARRSAMDSARSTRCRTG